VGVVAVQAPAVLAERRMLKTEFAGFSTDLLVAFQAEFIARFE
jgi:hypothetical protein